TGRARPRPDPAAHERFRVLLIIDQPGRSKLVHRAIGSIRRKPARAKASFQLGSAAGPRSEQPESGVLRAYFAVLAQYLLDRACVERLADAQSRADDRFLGEREPARFSVVDLQDHPGAVAVRPDSYDPHLLLTGSVGSRGCSVHSS